MGILQKFFGFDYAEERAQGEISFEDLFGVGLDRAGLKSVAGESVNDSTAMGVSTVWACCRIISDAISTLPLDSYIEKTKPSDIPRLLRPRPGFLDFGSGYISRIDFMGQTMLSLLLHANAYWATYRDGVGKIIWMEVLDPSSVEPERRGSEIFYSINGDKARLTRLDIMHIKGMCRPGELKGISTLQAGKESMGLTIAATKFGAGFFGNNAMPGAVIEVDQPMSETGIKSLRRMWNDIHQGAGNNNKLAVLTQGAKLSSIVIPPNDAQFLQTRQFQVNEIARLYGVPTSMLAHTDGPEMGKTIEDKGTDFVTYTLRGWTIRLEAALTWLAQSEGRAPKAGCVKLDLNNLLRGNHVTRMRLNMELVREGIITINEVRAEEGKAPVPWGDEPQSVQVQNQEEANPNSRPDGEDADKETNENE